jgi:hypothetical protein
MLASADARGVTLEAKATELKSVKKRNEMKDLRVAIVAQYPPHG